MIIYLRHLLEIALYETFSDIVKHVHAYTSAFDILYRTVQCFTHLRYDQCTTSL